MDILSLTILLRNNDTLIKMYYVAMSHADIMALIWNSMLDDSIFGFILEVLRNDKNCFKLEKERWKMLN